MKILKYISFLTAFIAMSACSEENFPVQESDMPDGDSFTVNVSMDVPQFVQVSSRAMGETPEYADLELYLVEFERQGTDPSANFLRKVYRPESETPAGDHVDFKVKLDKAEQGRVLHLIAVPKGTALTYAGEPLGSVPGSEAMIAQIITSGGVEAYWQHLDFENGYGTIDNNQNWTTSQDTKDKLTMVQMIRNFAQVTVTAAENATGFTIKGYALMNTPTKGTIAPWESNAFPTFNSGTAQIPYDQLNYSGIFPGDPAADVANQKPEELTFNNSPIFLYEYPANSVNATSLIVEIIRDGVTESSFYRIDLGHNVPVGNDENVTMFERFNILRNFRYNVRITGVASDGYPTAKEAAGGVVYNNLYFSVDTEQMLNISDGRKMLWVTFTTNVVTVDDTEHRTVYLGYKFRPNITSGGYNNGPCTILRDPVTANQGQVIDGDITTVTDNSTVPQMWRSNISNEDLPNWRFVSFTAKTPTTEQKREQLIVMGPDGIARTVTLLSRTPWRLWRNRVFAGNYNLRKDFPYQYLERENKVSTGVGEPLTVFFVIPDKLDKAMFPLSFVIESDIQDVENNPVGTLVVQSGNSLFDPTKTAIQYVKTVTWSDYNSELTENNPTGTIVSDEDGKTPIHRIRCRLRTINSVTSSTTKIRISNPYFELQDKDFNQILNGIIEVSFDRNSDNDKILEESFAKEASANP